MKYLKTYKLFESSGFNYLDMKHFEEFFTSEEIKSMMINLQDILTELIDLGYTYEYGVDDIDDEFYIIIHRGKAKYDDYGDIEYQYETGKHETELEDVIIRIIDFMEKDWYTSISCNYFSKTGISEFGSIRRVKYDNEGNNIDDKLLISDYNKYDQRDSSTERLLSDVGDLYKVRMTFILQRGKI